MYHERYCACQCNLQVLSLSVLCSLHPNIRPAPAPIERANEKSEMFTPTIILYLCIVQSKIVAKSQQYHNKYDP